MKPWILYLLLITPATAIAQGEFSNWYFGTNAGMTFKTGGPQKVALSAMQAGEGVASISDASGNLLFYSNGLKIWDRTHQLMKNGNDLLGGLSSAQGVLILPDPGNLKRYYVFTVTASGTAGTLSYSIVDMDGNGGFGEVPDGLKNQPLGYSQTEKLASARSGSCDYWLISHQTNTNMFEARRITAAGIQPAVQTHIGSMHNEIGMIKVAPNNRRVVATSVTGTIEVLDFDNVTGIFSNPIRLPSQPGSSTYSACFSPDNSKLYTNEGGYRPNMEFYQFDLSLNDTTAIAASKSQLGSVTTGLPLSLSDLQLGPDGRVYFTRMNTTCLGVIPNPNLKQPMCGFYENGVCNIGYVGLCLPNMVQPRKGLLVFDLGPDTTACPGTPVPLTAPPGYAATWSTGATTSSINVTAPGKYWLLADNGSCAGSDTIHISFGGRQLNLGNDTSVCTGSSITLGATGFTGFRWNDLSANPTLNVSSPGTYWADATDHCGISSSDTIIVAAYTPLLTLQADTAICSGDTAVLVAPSNFHSYSWSPGYRISRTDTSVVRVYPLIDTVYRLKAEESPGCFAIDSIRITVNKPNTPQLPADTVICEGNSFPAAAGTGFGKYLWFDGKTTSSIFVDTPATIWVRTVDMNGCIGSDTMQLSWKDCGNGLWVPTGFTPNGDYKNEVFTVGWQGKLESFRIRVYNRLGKLVFSSTNPKQSWDGTIGGSPAATQVFIWTCEYRFIGKPPQKQSGTVQLLR